jgi:predicted nucleic acid-binding protein
MNRVRYLLDTSALLAQARKEHGWQRVQAIFEEKGVEILVASVSISEFACRLHDLGATPAEAREATTAYRDLLDEVVAVDGQVAWSAFEMGCQTPNRLPLIDALIAAAAGERGACLVHRDQHMASILPHLTAQLNLAAEPSS